MERVRSLINRGLGRRRLPESPTSYMLDEDPSVVGRRVSDDT